MTVVHVFNHFIKPSKYNVDAHDTRLWIDCHFLSIRNVLHQLFITFDFFFLNEEIDVIKFIIIIDIEINTHVPIEMKRNETK